MAARDGETRRRRRPRSAHTGWAAALSRKAVAMMAVGLAFAATLPEDALAPAARTTASTCGLPRSGRARPRPRMAGPAGPGRDAQHPVADREGPRPASQGESDAPTRRCWTRTATASCSASTVVPAAGGDDPARRPGDRGRPGLPHGARRQGIELPARVCGPGPSSAEACSSSWPGRGSRSCAASARGTAWRRRAGRIERRGGALTVADAGERQRILSCAATPTWRA